MFKNFTSVIVLFIIANITLLAQPKLELDCGRTYDWGDVKQADSPLKTKVKILNTGSDTLFITRVKPGCGCTTAPLDKEIIPPEDFATLTVELNVAHYSGDISKSILIESNDTEKPRFYLMLKANVITPLLAVPHFMSFNTIELNQEAVGKVKLRNTTDNDMKIMKLTIEPEEFKVNIDEGTVIPPNSSIDLIVKYTPKEAGRFRGVVNIKTDHPDVTRYLINAWGMVTDPNEEINTDPNNVVVPPKK